MIPNCTPKARIYSYSITHNTSNYTMVFVGKKDVDCEYECGKMILSSLILRSKCKSEKIYLLLIQFEKIYLLANTENTYNIHMLKNVKIMYYRLCTFL